MRYYQIAGFDILDGLDKTLNEQDPIDTAIATEISKKKQIDVRIKRLRAEKARKKSTQAQQRVITAQQKARPK